MPVGWIQHKGKNILLVDYRGLKSEDEMIALLKTMPSYFVDKPMGDELLILVDLTDCVTPPGLVEAGRRVDEEFVNRYRVKRALLGITGPKVVLLKGFNLFAKHKSEPFDTKEQALRYLTK